MRDAPDLLRDLLSRARARGASAGDAVLVESDTFAVQVRLKVIDKVKQARERRLGLRLFFGQRSAITATSMACAAASCNIVSTSF